MEQEALLVDLSSLILEDENQNNIKLGDIIYLKSYLPDENKGLISGEGFGTNKLECLLLQKVLNQHLAYKQAELNIYRCLFRIIDNNFSFDKYAAENHNKHNTSNSDQLENETNLVYGQEIQLLHLYSKCFLCLNSQALAKENCCRELKLEENITQNSSFMFQSNTKNSGEPVLYGDILLLKSSVPHLYQWGLGIQQNEPYSEVHASQIHSTLRVCSYNENLDNQNMIINGDIILLKNRFFGGYLSVKRKFSSTRLFQKRQLLRNDKKINQNFLDIEVFKNQEKLQTLFQFSLENEIKPNSMWLLLGINYDQNQQNKKDYIKQKKTYLIKNVLTGAFLCLQNDNLNLTFDIITDKCEFYIRNQQKIDSQILVGEFYRIISKSFTYVVQCEDKNQVSVSQKSSKIQFDQQLFQVKRGPFIEAMTANKIQSFYFEILEFYQYLQEWGLDQGKNYSYLIAFKQQKQLQDEINQFAKLLQNIHSFLNSYEDLQQKQINQFYLCNFDIFDLLIALQQLIFQITYQENNFASTLADKTAQRIARQKFNPVSNSTKKKQFNLIEEIYLLIYQIIFDNLQCCDYIIEQDNIIDFLISQLHQYREIIEKILKQLVSKAKFNSGVANKWINRIKIISEENLEDQIFIIKIINLLISSQFHISAECQNLCRKKLFPNNEPKLIKFILKNDDTPLIHFYGNESYFRSANSAFCNFKKSYYPDCLFNEVYLELFAKWDNEKLYYGYEQYILGVLNLFASMCKGRNYKNMIIIKQTIGINLKFFEKVNMIKHSLLCKQIMIDLYLSLYFDIDPLAKISTFENTCYLRQELVDFSLDTESGVFFYENISSKNIKTTDVYSTFKMSSVNLQQNTLEFLNLKHFTKHIIYSQKFHQEYIQLFLQEWYPGMLIEDSNARLNYKQIAKTQLNFFLSLIILIKESIELGYNNLPLNLKIQSKLPFIFSAMIIQQKNKFKTFEFQEEFAFQKNIEKLRQLIQVQLKEQTNQFDFLNQHSWITEFLVWTTSVCNDFDLIESIFQEALNIYRVFFYLQENLQILYYLTNKQIKSENLFKDHSTLLFECLFGQQKLPRLNVEILNYLILNLNQQQEELQEIKEVEILDDEVELRYFSIVNGHTENSDILGPKEIQQHVKKALRFMTKTKQEKSGREKENEQSFEHLNKYLEGINKLFEELQQNNSSYFHSLQNMIRNASIHILVIEFFINPDDVVNNNQIVYFYKNFLKFWENFIKENQTNFTIILPHLEQLLKIILIPQPDALNKFTYQSLQLSKLELWKASNSVIDILIIITKNLDFRNNLIHIRAGKQYLKILRGFTKTSSKPHFNILSNQKQILHLLLQQFRNLIDPIVYFGEIENVQQQKFNQIDILYYQQLKLHATALNLIADTCQNYFLGIQEIQRILLFESLVTILQNGPYIVKAAYLRCIFELYINQVKQNTQLNDLIDLSQIKELLSLTIIPDLELMQQFSSTTLIQSTILVSNNEFWKYIVYVVEFLVSMMDEFRIMEKSNDFDFTAEFHRIEILFQGMLLINQKYIIQNNKDQILQILKLIKEFSDQKHKFGIHSRLQIYCIRMDIQFSDLIKHVESLKIKNNFEKLKEICNQNGKVYIFPEDSLKFKKISSRGDIQIDEWNNFKSSFKSFHEQREVTDFTERRQKDEMNLQVLKVAFNQQKQLNVQLQLKSLNLILQSDDFLSEDVQLYIFLNNLIRLNNNFLEVEKLKEFLLECKQIFTNHSQYLIKLCRVLLEIKRPSQQILDASQFIYSNEVQIKIDEYVQYQNIISESEIDLLALDQLNNQNMKQQLDALTFLQHLLDFGNTQVQQRIFVILKIKKKRKNFVQFFKDFFSIDVSAQIEFMRIKENTLYEQLCIKVLQLLQGLCENVHLEFQKFLRIQNETDSITNNFNFITETTSLLVNFIADKSIDEKDKLKLYQQGMLSLIEFSTGLSDNKREITKNSRLFLAFNKLFSEYITDDVLKPLKKDDDRDNYQIILCLSTYIKLLISLLDGNIEENKQVYKFLYDCVDISFLLQLSKKIYHLRIHPKKNNICVDRCCKNPCNNNQYCKKNLCIFEYKTKEDSLLIEAALSIFVIGLKLSQINQDDKYDIFNFEVASFEQQQIRENQEFSTKPDETQFEKTFSLSYKPRFCQAIYMEISTLEQNEENKDEVVEEQHKKIQKPLSISRKDEFFQFFREFIGRIEVVNQQGKIERILFQKPFVCKYITPNIQQHLIYQSNRETDEDRIASLMDNINFYHSQMIHYQRVSTIPIMHFGQKHWRKLKDLSYILCVFIVIFFIIWPNDIEEGNLYKGDDEENQQYQESKTAQIVLVINNIITIIQLVLNFFIILFCAVERYPIAINFGRSETNIKLIQNLKKEAGFKIPEFKMKYYDALGYLENNFDKKKAQKNPLRKIILLLILDFDNFYNVAVFGITIIAFFHTSVYCVLLLDIIKRSEVLQYIIKAFTENTQNLLVFGVLGLIGLVQFGFIINASLSDQFKKEQGYASDSLGYSIAHVINLGLRSGGGVGDSLDDYADPFEDPNKYWSRFFFDLTFFIIFNMIFIQMIFGIIVDKFGELRDQRSDLLKDIEGKCFICSLDRNVIDSKTKNGWYYHIYLEHNVYHMLYYLIYIKMKPITECNKLEKYIKDQVENKQSDFFPVQTTLELQEQE